jgi:hypothetical protein
VPIKFSEAIRRISLAKFKRKGSLEEDALSYCKQFSWDIGIKEYLKLRLAFGNSITVHTLTDGVVCKIVNTRILNLPHNLPHFLTTPFIVEARHDNVLFDDVVCLAGFLENSELYLITTFSDKNSMIQMQSGSYDGRKLEEINYTSVGFSGSEDKNFDRTDTFAFITIFALMIEADRTPIAIEEKRVRNTGGGNGINANNYKSDWIEKRVYIDKKYVPQYKNEVHDELDTDGRTLKDIYIHGFLRYQAYGPEHSLRKWIYVEGFDSTRWAKPGDTKIIVDMYEKS